MPSASPSPRCYYVVVTEMWTAASARGSRRCQNPFRLSSGGSNGEFFCFTRSIHFVFCFYFCFFPLQPQGHGGAHRGRGWQRRERLQAGLGSPDGSAARQLHRGVHREPHGAVRKGPSFEGIPSRKLCSSSTAAPLLRLQFSAPSSEASEGTSPFGNLLCKLIAFSDAAPHLLACDCSEDYPQCSTERCKGKKKPSGGSGTASGSTLITHPHFLTAVSSVQERFVHLRGSAGWGARHR